MVNFDEFINKERETIERFEEIKKILKNKNIVQLTSFGTTGIIICHMLYRMNMLILIPTIFIDTLYHFESTYTLINKIKNQYKDIDIQIVKPLNCNNNNDFIAKHGDELWKKIPKKYGYYTKIEPRNRIMKLLQSNCYINGRRRNQGFERSNIEFIEYNDEYIRIQPLYDWTEDEIWYYIRKYDLISSSNLQTGAANPWTCINWKHLWRWRRSAVSHGRR